ncbi:MAG: hypothetical protein ACE5OR_09915 [bacterium]
MKSEDSRLIMTKEKELKRKGWEKRSVVDEPRVKELVGLYTSLGFEVRVEPVRPEEMVGECTECFEVDCTKYRAIYTRRKPQN